MTVSSELLFVDPTIADPEVILAGLRPEVEGVMLETARPAAAQIAAILRERRGLDAIHIMAHGRAGEISFGSGVWSADSLEQDRDQLATIGSALAIGGSLRLWSCTTAAGDVGRLFVEVLAKVAGASVAAATNLVGTNALGGCWVLDAGEGSTQVPIIAEVVENYQGVMATKYWRGGNGNWNSNSWATSATGSANTTPPAAGDTVILENLISEIGSNKDYTISINTATNNIASLQIGDGGNSNDVNIAISSGGVLNVSGAITANFSSGGSAGAPQIQLSGTAALNAATLNLADSGGGPAGVVVGSGTLTVSGHILTGTTLNASGGTLDVFGTIDSGVVLQIATAAGSTLKIEGAATSATAISISNAAQTLEIGSAGNLTIGAAESITDGTIKLDGGTLTSASTVTIGSGAKLTGFGKVSAPLAGTGTITASGGTLEVTGTITNSGALALAIGAGATDKLLLDAASAATSATFSGATGTLELNTAGTLTLANTLAIGANTVKLDGSGSTLTANSTLSTGTITGVGKVAGTVAATGAGHITASGGALEVTGAVTNSGSLGLTIGAGASDKLLLDAASVATSATFSGSTGTLELNTAGTLTLANALAIGANTVKLDGSAGTVQLTDANGATLTGGSITGTGTISASTNLSGYGTIGISIPSAGTFTANGGTLTFSGAVDSTAASNFHIASGATLAFASTVGTGSVIPTIIFDSASSGTLDLTSTTLANFHATLSGFGTGDGIKVSGAASAWLDSTGKILTVYNSSNTSIGTLNLATSYTNDDFSVAAGGVITEAADAVSPAVSSVTFSPSSGDLNAGDTVTITLDMNEAVAVTGSPTVTLNDGGVATFTSGSHTSSLVFTYTVQAGQNTADLTLASTSAVNLNGGSIVDAAGKAASLTGANGANPSGTLQIDTTAPTAAATVTALSADSGTAGDFITNTAVQTVSGTFTGVLGADETIQVSANGGTTWINATVSGSTWSASGVTLSSGTGALTVRTIDGAGNTVAGTGHAYTLDTVTPTGGTPDLVAAADSGSSNTDNDTNVTAPTFQIALNGTVQAGDQVELKLGGSSLAHPVIHTITSADITAGFVQLTVTAGDLGSDGSKSITAVFSDAAGNTSTTSALVVTLDTTAPTTSFAAVTLDLATASDTGISNTDNLTNDSTPTITTSSLAGMAMSVNDVIQIIDTSNGNAVVGSYTVQASDLTGGVWNGTTKSIVLSTLATGTHALAVRLADLADNTAAASATPVAVTIDTTPPTLSATTPSDGATGYGKTSNVVLGFSENVYAGSGTITLKTGFNTTIETFTLSTGLGSNGGTITVSGSTVVINPGSSLSNNTTYYINISNNALEDAAGNFVAAINDTTTFNFKTGNGTDTTAPSAPSITSVTDDVGSITGPLANNAVTDDTQPVVRVSITGTGAVLGDKVQLFNDMTALGSAVILSSANITAGYVDIATPVLTNGATYNVRANVTDGAGNAGAESNTSLHVITIDTTAPTISSVADSPNSPNDVSGAPVTLTLNFSENVVAQAGTKLTLSDGSVASYVSGSGGKTLTFQYTAAATASNVTVTGLQSGGLADAAGNSVTSFGEVICFMAGTQIGTPLGEAAVEGLKAGDLVLTADGREAKVRWIGQQTVSMAFADPLRVLPIRIRAGALGDGAPVRDLLVSPDHALLVDGVLIHAGALVNGVSIAREADVPSTFVYYHIELDDHALVLAEGVPAETFVDNVQRLAFDNWAEHEALNDRGGAMVEMAYPRAKSYRQTPRSIRERLMARAIAIYGRRAKVAA